MNIEQMICPNCQSNNFEINGDTYSCKYCLSNFTKKQIDSKMFVDLRLANFERNTTNFDKAKLMYKDIIENNPNEDLSDAYWGQFLCEQRVVFEEDGKGEKFPSFYRMNLNENVTVDDSPSFAKALSYALKHNRNRLEVFNTLADKIDNARKMYFDIQSKTKPFDIFICFKNSDKNGNHTPDRELAMDIYNELSGKYNIFFSEKTLKNIKSNYREYEPNIYYGLYTAKVMLLICSKKEYLESQWLKNEWSRFTQINRQGGNEKCIIPIFTDNFNPNDLPDELWHTQGIFDDRKLMTTLENTLENIIHPVDKLEELRKQQENELKKQREEQEKQRKEQEDRYAQLEKLLKLQEEREERRQKEEKEREEKRRLEQEKRDRKLQEEQQKTQRLLEENQRQLEKAQSVKVGLKSTQQSNEKVEKTEPEKKLYTENDFDKNYFRSKPKISADRKIVIFGSYPQDSDIPEPIKWNVISDYGKSVVLVSDKILDAQKFDTNLKKYDESDIKKWLNNEFLNNAFNEEERKIIKNSYNGDINLLSRISFSVHSLKEYKVKKITEYAKKKGINFDSNTQLGSYYIQDDDFLYNDYAQIITQNNYFGKNKKDTICGIVPYIRLNDPIMVDLEKELKLQKEWLLKEHSKESITR